MPRRLRAATAATAAFLLLAACGGGGDGDGGAEPGSTGGLRTVKVTAGEVDVEIEPVRLDDGGAEFEITMDTHSVELTVDPARTGELVVDGRSWPNTGWAGAGPSGHHREGRLSFAAAGPARGTARLTIGGFPAPVEATWTLGGG